MVFAGKGGTDVRWGALFATRPHLGGQPAASAARGLRLVLMEIGRLEQMGLSFRQAPAIVTHGDPAACIVGRVKSFCC